MSNTVNKWLSVVIQL